MTGPQYNLHLQGEHSKYLHTSINGEKNYQEPFRKYLSKSQQKPGAGWPICILTTTCTLEITEMEKEIHQGPVAFNHQLIIQAKWSTSVTPIAQPPLATSADILCRIYNRTQTEEQATMNR